MEDVSRFLEHALGDEPSAGGEQDPPHLVVDASVDREVVILLEDDPLPGGGEQVLELVADGLWEPGDPLAGGGGELLGLLCEPLELDVEVRFRPRAPASLSVVRTGVGSSMYDGSLKVR